MKKASFIFVVLMVALMGLGFSQLRLGIGAQTTYDGVMITDVFYGYPAYGNLQTGDQVVYARVIRQSKPVVCGNGVVVMGTHGNNININISINNNVNQNIFDAEQFQRIVLSSPADSTLILTVRRYGRLKTYAINLLNDGTVKVFAAN